jgi:glyoxylase-like metal-dependent hydrolase (beta-lactamase superfamily II)
MYIQGLTVGPVETNCYILGDEATKLAALIDPGDAGAELVRFTKGQGYEIAMILLTHGHFDHIGGVKEAVEVLNQERETPLPVYIHEEDYPCAPASFDRHITLEGVPGVRFYGEGDTLTLGGISIQVISTPGHTCGGVCLIAGDSIFTGDTLFYGSCGRTDFETSSPEAMLASLKRLALLEGDYKVYPGHEGATLLSDERKNNPYMIYARKL